MYKQPNTIRNSNQHKTSPSLSLSAKTQTKQMAFSKSIAFFAALLVVLPMAALAFEWDNIAPSIAAEVCKEVECGRGTCKFDVEVPLGFSCECDAGWKRTREGDDDLKFLPCVIPNCTLDYSCQPAPPPVPEKEIPRNLSVFDPCYWVYCGEGNCVRNGTYEHTPICECKSGSYNLLNVSAFPCYNECTLQPDCKSLGITVAKSTSTDNNQATSFLPGKLQLMTMAMVYVVMILWK